MQQLAPKTQISRKGHARKFGLAHLQQAAKVDPATELQLRADTAVPYGRVVQLIGMAQSVGLSRIGLVAHPVSGAPLPDAARKP